MKRLVLLWLLCLLCGFACAAKADDWLRWDELPAMPDELGFAGSFVGVHQDALIVAGGANFPNPVWDSDKIWHDRVFVLTKHSEGYRWENGGTLPRRVAYGASVSTSDGVLCMGGNDENETFSDVFLLSWDPRKRRVETTAYPSLPKACAFSAATQINDVVYLAGGQSGSSLETAMTNFWSLDLSLKNKPAEFRWQELPAWPGPSRAFNLTVSQHNGYDDCVYVISGRRQNGPSAEPESTQFLRDVWEFSQNRQQWRRKTDVPRCVMAGTSIAYGQSHVLVLGGATQRLFFRTDELGDRHPGFIKQSLAYHTITDTWAEAGATPVNQVTTTAVRWGDDVIVPTGEIRPRVRSKQVFRVSFRPTSYEFGPVNYLVLFSYLIAMVGVGVFFARRNKTTNDYFRAGSHLPWWAAGCSIFATMLSSLTYTGLPSKAFAQDWVYSIGNLAIPVVAVVAVYVAMPFFRSIDATSAYEYLEKRFSRTVRLFGSASFTLFHLFRMAVVLSLTGLAIAVATPMSPIESVLLMGVLSVLYCTLGGIEAVVWTDTIQTFVLLGGAVVALAFLVMGTHDGVSGMFAVAEQHDKFRLANWHLDPTNTQIALWVVVVGSLGQQLSSYTADQAVVQRYMTTADKKLAARSIWTNALLAIPATMLFFAIGTALFAFYQSHPDRLSPGITTDQIFPYFIASELPLGLAGLIVAGIFSAAQSTVSTSMNSIATTLVTDFLRPINACSSEASYLKVARLITLVTGIAGTLLGLIFVNPEIKSLFDTFLVVIGLFMGVLGGLFLLGATTTRANSRGALFGAIAGSVVMFSLWKFTSIQGFLYTTCGITTCFLVGYLASWGVSTTERSLAGLTIHTINRSAQLQSIEPSQS